MVSTQATQEKGTVPPNGIEFDPNQVPFFKGPLGVLRYDGGGRI